MDRMFLWHFVLGVFILLSGGLYPLSLSGRVLLYPLSLSGRSTCLLSVFNRTLILVLGWLGDTTFLPSDGLPCTSMHSLLLLFGLLGFHLAWVLVYRVVVCVYYFRFQNMILP